MSDLTPQSGVFDDPAKDSSEGNVNATTLSPDGISRLQYVVQQCGGAGPLSQRAMVSERTISRLMNGQRVRRQTLLAIAQAAGVRHEWLAAGEGAMLRADAASALYRPTVPSPPITEPAVPDYDDADADKFRHLRETVAKRGGEAAIAREAGVPEEVVRAILAVTETPGGAGGASANPESGAPPGDGGPSIWSAVDFEVLVRHFELQEDLDKLGGGQLKSVRSRMRRAFNAYDIHKNDKE
jgi:transcriptional regulator with XRE-family HTH domain